MPTTISYTDLDKFFDLLACSDLPDDHKRVIAEAINMNTLSEQDYEQIYTILLYEDSARDNYTQTVKSIVSDLATLPGQIEAEQQKITDEFVAQTLGWKK
jgi:hypothetical protein